LRQNFKIWFKLFFNNLKNSFGSFKLLLFYIMIIFYSIFGLKNNNSYIFKLIALSALFMFANNILIALVIHSIKRYTFYFDWVIFVVFLILINEIFKQKLVNES
jgi:hypothetical protein